MPAQKRSLPENANDEDASQQSGHHNKQSRRDHEPGESEQDGRQDEEPQDGGAGGGGGGGGAEEEEEEEEGPPSSSRSPLRLTSSIFVYVICACVWRASASSRLMRSDFALVEVIALAFVFSPDSQGSPSSSSEQKPEYSLVSTSRSASIASDSLFFVASPCSLVA